MKKENSLRDWCSALLSGLCIGFMGWACGIEINTPQFWAWSVAGNLLPICIRRFE